MSRFRYQLLAVVLPTLVFGQASVVRGVVIARGLPLARVNVFDLTTLSGTVTRDDGRFAIPIADSSRRTLHLVARAIGYAPVDTTLSLPTTDSLVLTLRPLTVLLPMAVQAGRYTANASPKSTLTAIEVASTPGANADINGAIKTLPGVQNVDEGSGLFVRGGDFTETRIFVDGAPLFTAYQFEAPTGSVAGTINPFLTSSITFSSGGFGAEWGNALSGVVDLRTQGRPVRSFTNVNASIIGLAVSEGVALPHGVGVSATAGATNLSALLDLNGNPRAYSPAPHARTVSGLAGWDYSANAGVKLFALYQSNGFAIPVDDPALRATFNSDRASDIAVLSWRDTAGVWRPFASASTSGLSRDESKGAYDQASKLRSTQLRLESPFVLGDRVTLTSGAEVERVRASFSGRVPANSYDATPGAPTTASSLDAASTRTALFASMDTRPTGSTELIAGLRSTTSDFATARTYDPRISLAWVSTGPLSLTAAWGVYHQIADPAFLDRLNGSTRLPALGSRMAIVGAQLGEGTRQTRLELWSKRYDNLTALTRTYSTVSGLTGRAAGGDLFARTTLSSGVDLRVTYSVSSSRRTDPNAGVEARAPFDVTSSVTAVVQKNWRNVWTAAVATRFATGHPFTDVVSAAFDSAANVYVPSYGFPNAQRLPDFMRTDLSLSRQRPFGADRFGVAFIGINNVFNEVNTFSYTWSRDYSTRIPVRSAVNRTFFIGANLVLLH